MEIHLKITGTLLIVLAGIHVIFPKYFNWENELKSLSLINKQMMGIHTFFVALIVLLMGLLCVTSAKELLHTPLGSKVALGLGIFWLLRLLVQFFGYSSKLWRGKKFETFVHIVFSALWTYLTGIFLAVYWMS
ncbi:hypothetical protein AAG747_11775 [Rapidithrix thailandica]|uniref:Uncharacterized protein n=1 Tax=Rapidithrix thailandica TaxID=413964 RepID=A0AAW9RUZ1_9BACT